MRKQLLLQQRTVATWRDSGNEAFAVFERRTSAIRKVIESISSTQLDDRAKAALLELVGLPRFKCPKIQCLKFAAGFPNQRTRDSHVKEHERPFKCPAEGCYARTSGFSSQSALDAHVERFHPDDTSPSTLFPQFKGMKESNIFTACSQGNLEEVKAFHCQGVGLDTATKAKGGLTPLVLAARHGHANVCAYLIKHGVDVQRFRYGDMSPLAETIKQRDFELFCFLWSTVSEDAEGLGASFDIYVSLALIAGSNEILEELLAWKHAPELRPVVPDIMKEFCQRKCWDLDSPSGPDTTLVYKLFRRAFPSLCEPNESILRPNSRPESQNLALEDWHSVLLTRFLPLENTLLHIACDFENYRAAAFLLDQLKPEDLRTTNKFGDTPLHTLARERRNTKSRVHVARRLVHADNGVAANIKNANGELPLHIASCGPCEEVFSLLVDNTRDLDEETNTGKTALEVAVRENYASHVTRLLATGRVDIMKRNKEGQTAFSVAAGCWKTSTAILQLLYSTRTSLALLSDDTPDRLTPLHHALHMEWPQAETIKYLLSLPEAEELVQVFLSSPANNNPKRSAQLFKFALKNGFQTAAKSILRSGIVGASEGTPDMWKAAERLGQSDPEILQIVSSILNRAGI